MIDPEDPPGTEELAGPSLYGFINLAPQMGTLRALPFKLSTTSLSRLQNHISVVKSHLERLVQLLCVSGEKTNPYPQAKINC